MSPQNDKEAPASTGSQSPQELAEGTQTNAPASTGSHGATGEGAGSAMAHLISQEQARMVPGAPEDAPTGSS